MIYQVLEQLINGQISKTSPISTVYTLETLDNAYITQSNWESNLGSGWAYSSGVSMRYTSSPCYDTIGEDGQIIHAEGYSTKFGEERKVQTLLIA